MTDYAFVLLRAPSQAPYKPHRKAVSGHALVRGALSGDTLERGSGLPIAARLKTGEIVTSPAPDYEIDADALYVIVGPKERAAS